MKYVIFLIILIQTFNLIAQKKYPLSRQDSAMITKYIDKSAQQDSLGDKKEASRYLNDAAMIYWEHNHYETAIKHYKKSLKYNENLGNENGIAMIHNNLAMIYSDTKDYKKSKEYFNKTLAARKSKNEKIGIISACINLSVVLNNLKEFDTSIERLHEALTLAREMNDPQQMRSCYGMLSETYEKAGNVEKSIHYFNLYRTFHEMVQEEKITKTREELENERLKRLLVETQNKNKELELKHKDEELHQQEEIIADYDSTTQILRQNLTKEQLRLMVLKQDAQIKDLQVKKEKAEMQEKQLRSKRLIQSSIGGVLALIIISLVLLYAYRQKRKTNIKLARQNDEILHQQEEIMSQRDKLQVAYSEIEKKNKQITDSINYAQLIQAAMLERKDKLARFIPESFILYLPRDIVSGDFYWYEAIDDKLIIAAVDCTGHGVPGAFMSMIGYNLLNKIVVEREICEPDKILTEMDLGIKAALNQKYTKNQDGMDMALCVIDKKKRKLAFAGAKNPLILIINNEIQYVKGSRFAVGGYPRRVKDEKSEQKKVFECKTFDLADTNRFYIFSDGYVDQFGGANDKKFSSKGLRNLINENYKKPMRQQLSIYLDTFNDWKENYEQIDDVLLIGGVIELFNQK